MKFWIARDKDGSLWGYSNKPVREGEIFIDTSKHLTYFSIYNNLFPEITWENSPVEFIENTKEEQQ